MKTDFEKPCNECPFCRTSPPGWLGPWEPDILLRAIEVTEFPCHRTIPDGGVTDISDPRLQGCAGAAIFLNNSCALSRCETTLAHQRALRDIEQAVKDTVFRFKHEFLQHHTSGWASR